MIIWITGLSGTGKSTLINALRERGHQAIDSDDDQLSRWQDRTTGRWFTDAEFESVEKYPGFMDRYQWNMDGERLRQLADEFRLSTLYLGGGVANEEAVWHLFDRCFYLHASDEVLTERLANRTTNDFGKDPEELREVLYWNSVEHEKYRARGAAFIDASLPLEHVAKAVLAQK